MAWPKPGPRRASMVRRVIRFARLDPSRRGLFLRAAFLLWKHRLLLWLRPFRMPEAAPARDAAGSVPTTAAGSRPSPATMGWAVSAASRLVPRSTCLVRALAAHALCRRYGYPAQLRLGARRDPTGKFEAHAWLELGDDVVVGGHEAPDEYSVFRPGAPEPGS